MNWGFGKDFYRKGNSVKRSGPFSEKWKVAVLIPFPKISSDLCPFSSHWWASASPARSPEVRIPTEPLLVLAVPPSQTAPATVFGDSRLKCSECYDLKAKI